MCQSRSSVARKRSPLCVHGLTQQGMPVCVRVTQQALSSASRSRHCQLCDTADIFCCVTQQTISAVLHFKGCLLCLTADNVCFFEQQAMFFEQQAARALRSRQCLRRDTVAIVRSVTQQTMSALLPTRRAGKICYVTQQTFGAAPQQISSAV